MRRLAIMLLFSASAFAQQTVPLQLRRIFNITTGPPTGCIDNRSSSVAQMNYHSFIATGTGTWSVQMQYSDTACTGPWTSYGSLGLVDQATTNGIGIGQDGKDNYHLFLSFVITGSGVSLDYSGTKNFYLSTAGSGSGVISVFGRTGNVVAQTGDYTASQVTNAFVTNLNNQLGAIANTSTDISTPTAPASGHTTSYSKGGTMCAVSSFSVETCMGANTALSNLVSVSINTALLFQSAKDIGSTTAPPRYIYLYGDGTFSSTSLKLTATLAAGHNNTWNVPDVTSDSFVGLAATQTLTNKTLTTPTIASFVNATHTHLDAAGGGVLTEGAIGFTDVTTGNSTTSQHGFLPKLSGDATQAFCGNGVFAATCGGSGGITGLYSATDFLLTRVSASVVAINATASVTTPVPGRVGRTVYTFTGQATGTISGTNSSGPAFMCFGNDGTLILAHNLALTFTGSGLTVLPATSNCPSTSTPLWTFTITNNTIDTITETMDKRAFFSTKPSPTPGSFLTVTQGDVDVIGFDTTTLTNPSASKLPTWTGSTVTGDCVKQDSSGNLLDTGLACGGFQDSSGTVTITGNSSDQTLFTTTVPGGSIASGKCLVIKYNVTAPAVSTVFKIFYGATSGTIATLNNASGMGSATLCNNVGSTGNQNLQIDTYATAVPAVASPTNAATSMAIDSTTSQTLKLTANSASGTITGNSWIVR